MSAVPRAAAALGAAGLIPFVGAAIGVALGVRMVPEPIAALLIYGAVILCFMAGTLWGLAVAGNRADSLRLLGASVVPPILVFLGFVFLPQTQSVVFWLICLQIAGFGLLLVIEANFRREALLPPWWFRLRIPLTTVVVICLLTALFAGT